MSFLNVKILNVIGNVPGTNQPTDNLWNFAQIIGNKNLSLCGHILKRNNFRLSDVCMYVLSSILTR